MSYAAGAIGFFLALNRLDPCRQIDFPFYLRLYASIGVVSGLLASFIGHVVANGRTSVSAVTAVMAIPYCFVMFVALGMGPPVGVLTTLIFGSILLLSHFRRPTVVSALPDG